MLAADLVVATTRSAFALTEVRHNLIAAIYLHDETLKGLAKKLSQEVLASED